MTAVPNPATAADVTAAFERDLTDAEQRVLPNWLAQAWTVLTARVPGLDARLANEMIPAATVQQVVVAMVERKLRNPDGLRSWNGDDYTEVVDQALSSGQIEPTPTEVARLTPYSGPGVYAIVLA